MSSYKRDLDPAKVEELCENERWSSKGLQGVRASKFGTIPEDFEKAASFMPEGSEEKQTLMAAFKKAASIYRDQILSDVRQETTGKPRAELESINETLFQTSKLFENDGTYVSARLLWAAHMVGDWHYKNGGSKGLAKGDGYQQFKFRPGKGFYPK
jgi:hypothetical protein